jgi:hypothetical protein
MDYDRCNIPFFWLVTGQAAENQVSAPTYNRQTCPKPLPAYL